jgi:hypothetical protein
MSRRQEKRNFLALPVRVSGTDSAGKSFRHVVCTLDVSAQGARITGLQPLDVKAGQELTLEHQKDRVRFRVMWIGQPNTARQGQLGLRTLEPEKKLSVLQDQIAAGDYVDTWQAPKWAVEDTADDRRAATRFDCDRGIQYWTDKSSSPVSGTLDNISLTGCFVSTKFPLPRHSRVQMILHLYGMKIPAQGEVRAAIDGQGMGIMFTALERDSEIRVKKAVQRLGQTSQSNAPKNQMQQKAQTNEQILEEIRAWFDRSLTMTWEEYFDIQVRLKGNLVSASIDKEPQ